MIIEIQGHSDDVLELLYDNKTNEQMDVGDGDVAIIKVGNPNKTQMVISCRWEALFGWVFSLHIAGWDVVRKAGELPGRIDVELNRWKNGPRWVVDVPDDATVHTYVEQPSVGGRDFAVELNPVEYHPCLDCDRAVHGPNSAVRCEAGFFGSSESEVLHMTNCAGRVRLDVPF